MYYNADKLQKAGLQVPKTWVQFATVAKSLTKNGDWAWSTDTGTLSAPADTLSLNGTISGTRIRFGTVGSTAITYSGTVSGRSMSGTYQVNGANGGNWSAKTSG